MAKSKESKPVASIATDRVLAAQQAIAELNKKYGARTIIRVGDKAKHKHPCIPTGIYQIDSHVIQAGGMPRGRISEVYGPPSSGKTTIVLHAVAYAQSLGELAAFVDAEHALDPAYAAALGVDVDALEVCQPDSGEQALEVAEGLCRSGAFGIVVVDSVAALVPQAELNGDMGDAHVGLQARLMSQALRKLTGAVSKTNTALVFVNQTRQKVGVMYGNPETTAGGLALPFYASLRLDVRRVATNKIGEEAISNTVKIKAAKNKIGSPYREALVDIEFGKGFDKVGSILKAGIANGVVPKAGSWLTLDGQRYQGEEQATTALTVDPELYRKIYDAVLAKDAEPVAA